jgi:RHS repeat-associated protein
LASSETVDVYAKWVEGAERSNAVNYTVHHAGGSTTINLNQRINGTVWNWLGRFTINPASNHRVVVTDSTDGVVVADAVRFVSVTTSGVGLMYVHSDHLGTPQKMTDGSQALVWDALYQPFGESHSIMGTASNNQRFPGQYFDTESEYHYNYFRDYDPTAGRYVQSDPIGLDGGLNTYGYVGGNPLGYLDPSGTECIKPGVCDREVDKCVAAAKAQAKKRSDGGNGNCIARVMARARGCQDEACVQNELYKIPTECGGGTRLPSECVDGIQNCSYKQDALPGRPEGRFNQRF